MEIDLTTLPRTHNKLIESAETYEQIFRSRRMAYGAPFVQKEGKGKGKDIAICSFEPD